MAGILRTKIGRLLRWKEERSVAESWRGRPMSGGDWRHDVRRRYHDGAGAHASAIESSHVRSVSALKITVLIEIGSISTTLRCQDRRCGLIDIDSVSFRKQQ